MSRIVKREHVFFAFGPDSASAIEVEQGEEIVIETHDCFQGRLRSEADPLGEVDWNQVNPATGPVYIRGARAGDILRVDILDVKVGDLSIMVASPVKAPWATCWMARRRSSSGMSGTTCSCGIAFGSP